MATKRWNPAKEGKVLGSLFENGIADPRFVKAAEIDPVKEMRDEFKDFSKEAFRRNYQTTAAKWMAAKAIEGTRFKALNRNLDSTIEEKKDEEFVPEEIEEEVEVEEEPVAPRMPARKPTIETKSVPATIASSTSGYKYKSDERKWEAVYLVVFDF